LLREAHHSSHVSFTCDFGVVRAGNCSLLSAILASTVFQTRECMQSVHENVLIGSSKSMSYVCCHAGIHCPC
jgi:hypothetical protein